MMIRKLARLRRQCRHHNRLYKQHESCFPRTQSQNRLQIDGQQETNGKGCAVVQHRREVRQRKLPIFQQKPNWQDSLRDLQLMEQKAREDHTAHCQADPGIGLVQQLGQAIHHKHHRQPIKKCPEPIPAGCLFLDPFLTQEAHDRQNRDQTNSRNETENAAPAQIIIQQTSEDRPKSQPDIDHRDIPADSPSPLVRWRDQCQDRHAGRIDHGCADTLDSPKEQQTAHPRSQSHSQR